MTAATLSAPASERARWKLARMALLSLRELRSGLGGLYIFIACIALGVAIIAGIGTLADALRAGFESQGTLLLGGDATMARPHRTAGAAERAWMAARGRVSETATLRAMARHLDTGDQILIELKGVDQSYPLVGAIKLRDGVSLDAAVRQGAGAAVDPILLAQLGLSPGDSFELGKTRVTVRGVSQNEPDKIADRLSFGPRVFVSLDTLAKTGLAEPGSLVRWRYALQLSGGAEPADLLRFRDEVQRDLPDAGFTIADRRDPQPQVTKTLDRLQQFLTLIGLTALLIGGVGVANAVATYIDRRRKVIATFKSLGAGSRLVFVIHLVQIVVIAAIGIMFGLVLGLLIPPALGAFLGKALPIELAFAIRPGTLLVATAYGLFVSLLFSLWPLGKASLIRPAVLFREESVPDPTWPRWWIIALLALIVAALFAMAIGLSEAKRIAFYFCATLVAIFAVFAGLGHTISFMARRVRRPRRAELALALRNLGAPDGLTRSVVISLGAGLSLLVAVALANASIVAELVGRLPVNSPDYFVLDLPETDLPGFRDLVQREIPGAHINQAPMMRGRLIKLGNRPVEQVKAPPEAQWVLSGDRGLTYAENVPEGSVVVAGEWWAQDYAGPPLVSFESELARMLGLKLGDSVTVNVLGRNLTARIANLRDVRWESLAINFVMVFSPNTLRGAPHNLLATVSLPSGVPLAREASLAKTIGKAYPAVTAIRVKDAINAFSAVFERVMTAIRVAGGVTLLAGALVLAGALATSQRRRVQQSIILKVLGATRARVLLVHFAEYALLALVAGASAILVGSVAAWIAVTRVMELSFVFSGWAVLQALGASLVLVALLGSIGTWRVLRAPPAPHLRSE